MLEGEDEPRLDCLDGAPAPSGLLEDLQSVAGLSEAARRDLWAALEPNLADALDDRIGGAMAKFCRERDVTPEQLAPVVKACRLLFRSGAALGVIPPKMGPDLVRCGLGEELVRGTLLPCYERAYSTLRQRIVADAVAEHGNLVLDLGWRVDSIRTSHRGRGINTPVALVSFRYRDGSETRRITLQMLPDMLERMQAEITKILR